MKDFNLAKFFRKTLRIVFIVLFLYFPVISFAQDITLQWDANTESNLGGYMVHYKIDTSGGAPYNGSNLIQYNGNLVDSPIDVGNVTQVTLSIPEENLTKVYFFSVTAYTNEVPPIYSGYSNEVATFRILSPSDNFFIGQSGMDKVSISGYYEAGKSVEVFIGLTSYGITTVDQNGLWSTTIDFSSFSDGLITLSAKADTTTTPVIVGTLDKSAVKGDIDLNGTVTPADAMAGFSIYLTKEWEECSAKEQYLADYDNSGSITPADSTAIFQSYLAQ